MGCGCFKMKSWWFCNSCKRPVALVKEQKAQEILEKHKQACPGATFRIRKLNQWSPMDLMGLSIDVSLEVGQEWIEDLGRIAPTALDHRVFPKSPCTDGLRELLADLVSNRLKSSKTNQGVAQRPGRLFREQKIKGSSPFTLTKYYWDLNPSLYSRTWCWYLELSMLVRAGIQVPVSAVLA